MANESMTAFMKYGWNIPETVIRKAVRKGENRLGRRFRLFGEKFGAFPLVAREGWRGTLARRVSDNCSYQAWEDIQPYIVSEYLPHNTYQPIPLEAYERKKREVMAARAKRAAY